MLLLSMDHFSGCWKTLCIFTGWFRRVGGSWSRVLSVLLFYWTNRRWQNHSALLQMGGITRARWSHVAHAHIGSLVSGFVIVVILRSPEFILGRSIILLSLLIHSPVSLASSSKTPEHRCAEASRSTYSSSSLRHTICPAPGMWPSGSHLAPVAA